MSITLSINGAAAQSAAELGWSFETLTRRNAAPDVATLRRVRDANEAMDIQPNSKVVIWMDGVRTFTGTAQAAQFSLTEGGSTITLPILGPWWHLMQLMFTRADLHLESGVPSGLPPEVGTTFTIPSGGGAGTSMWNGTAFAAATAGSTYKWARAFNLAASPKEVDVAYYVSACGTVCDPNWAASPIYRTLYEATCELLTYVLEVHDRLGLEVPFAVNLAQLETDLGTTVSPRYRDFRDQRVGSVFSTLMACKPDVATWFDYSQEIPELRIRSASVETQRELVPGVLPLMRVSASPKPELKPAGIVVTWADTSTLPYTWRGYRRPVYVDKYPATVLPHEPGVVTYTLDFDDGLPTFKPQLAQALMEAIGVLRATGSMSMSHATTAEASAARPGLTYRLTGDPALNDAQLLVQGTTWKIATGQVDYELGYPRALDLQSVSDLKGWITWTFTGALGGGFTALVPPPVS